MAEAIDLFAGPGGWDEGLKSLGVTDVTGLDNDAAACATAEAAGHRREQVDIALANPLDYAACGALPGLIGSPPCPGFSPAGLGLGRKDFALLTDAIAALAGGIPADTVLDIVRQRQHDPRSALTLEPLRWALALMPGWIALEQVANVLPLWQAIATALEARGYKVWTGQVRAEQHGVAQTRKRAGLMASLDDVVAGPVPTHSLYHSRSPQRLDEGVLRWVTMAEGIGWGMTARPYPTIACSSPTGGPDKEKVGGSAARAIIYAEQAAGRWKPTPALEGEDCADITWPYDRPSPTIVGSFAPDVVAAPGYRKAGDPPRQKTPGSVRITLQEAGVLQSFRADYPWQGTKSQQFQQVGNAVPPLLAAHILSALTGRAVLQETAA